MILYPKHEFKIECAEIINDKRSGYHVWIVINSPINKLDMDDHSITFIYKNKKWIYWASMSTFLEYFKCVDEVRNEKINEIIND